MVRYKKRTFPFFFIEIRIDFYIIFEHGAIVFVIFGKIGLVFVFLSVRQKLFVSPLGFLACACAEYEKAHGKGKKKQHANHLQIRPSIAFGKSVESVAEFERTVEHHPAARGIFRATKPQTAEHARQRAEHKLQHLAFVAFDAFERIILHFFFHMKPLFCKIYGVKPLLSTILP